MDKNKKIAFGSLISKAIKILVGPITLIVISNKLTPTELAYYYTFFSLISIQQLAELGIGHVIKQYISHDYKIVDDYWTKYSKIKIKNYFYFSLLWFFFISLFILFVVGIIGYYYLNIKPSDVNWQLPWILLVIISSISIFITPINILFDGIQKQELIIKANVFSGLLSSIILWISITVGAGLYSISIYILSIFLSSLFIYCSPLIKILHIFKKINYKIEIKNTFEDVWGLLKKVSLVWAFGFLFWNGFNLITFQIYNAEDAGKIIFLITLGRAGFQVAESITQGQISIYSHIISNGDIKKAKKEFKKYSMISISILILGYFLFFIFWYIKPDFYMFKKLPNKEFSIQVFLYYSILLVKTLDNNFIRCFKVEPFVKTALLESILIPIVYFISSIYIKDLSFLICSFIIGIFLFYTLHLGREVIKGTI